MGTISIGALSGGYYLVTGVATNFLSPDGVTGWTVAVGDMLICGNQFGIVGVINSTTSLGLVFWSGGVVAAGAAYAINRLSGMASQSIAGLMQQYLGVSSPAGRQAVSDANATIAASTTVLAFIALTAARVVTLPAAAGYLVTVDLIIVDETGACSGTDTLTVNPAGSDLINGVASKVISTAYGSLRLRSNGSTSWTVVP